MQSACLFMVAGDIYMTSLRPGLHFPGLHFALLTEIPGQRMMYRWQR